MSLHRSFVGTVAARIPPTAANASNSHPLHLGCIPQVYFAAWRNDRRGGMLGPWI
jgi:hypothetical protein